MRRLVFFICFILIALPLCLELFAEETITLTTYYPSPSGVYKRLTATEGISFNGTFPGDATGTPVCIRDSLSIPNYHRMQFYANDYEYLFPGYDEARVSFSTLGDPVESLFTLKASISSSLSFSTHRNEDWPAPVFSSVLPSSLYQLEGAISFDSMQGQGKYLVIWPYAPAIISGRSSLGFVSITNYNEYNKNIIYFDFGDENNEPNIYRVKRNGEVESLIPGAWR